jgi:predicted transcriptional regulator YdeE
MNDIGAHWERFYSENIIGEIPDKIDNEVLGLYTDYEGDHTQPYTLILGCRVDTGHAMPPGHGMTNISIPESKYAVFTAKGKMPDCIVKTWGDIWNSGINRAYKFDFEVYGEKSHNPEDAEVDIYISVK